MSHSGKHDGLSPIQFSRHQAVVFTLILQVRTLRLRAKVAVWRPQVRSRPQVDFVWAAPFGFLFVYLNLNMEAISQK